MEWIQEYIPYLWGALAGLLLGGLIVKLFFPRIVASKFSNAVKKNIDTPNDFRDRVVLSVKVRVYVLVLVPIYDKNIEHNLAVAFDEETIRKFYDDCLSKDKWKDRKWTKTFKQGSRLEEYNPHRQNPKDPTIFEYLMPEDQFNKTFETKFFLKK